MKIAFVSAAWRRPGVTQLALAQRAHLCEELAGRGHDATAVIVADDENLEIAEGFGFHTREQNNSYLGRKFNDGFELAAEWGAEIFVLIGSDDWMHIDLFDTLPEPWTVPGAPTPEQPLVIGRTTPEAHTGREIAVVNLATGRLSRCRSQQRMGVIPWIFPRTALEGCSFRPIPDTQQRGIDGALSRGLRVRPKWTFKDPHSFCRVDFKSEVNLNSYEKLAGAIGYGPEMDAFDALKLFYPPVLVELARSTAEALV